MPKLRDFAFRVSAPLESAGKDYNRSCSHKGIAHEGNPASRRQGDLVGGRLAAEKGEPTTITKRGRPAAVVVSHSEWMRLKTRAPSFADLLLAVPPLQPEDLPKRRPARVMRDPGFE
jgi:antitoxin Phd